jgi:hypothetical protein
MQYTRAYRFLFDSPNWMQNVLFCTLCVLSTQLVPVVGYLVLLGYVFEVVEFMQRNGRDTGYPDFTLDRFKDYLVRGAWPFLVELVVMVPIVLVLLVVGAILSVLVIAVAGKEAAPWLLVALYLLGMLSILAMSVALRVVLAPMLLRSGLMQDFKAGFATEFVKDFLRRVGKDLVFEQLFWVLTATLLTLAGLLFCLIGVYPAAALTTVAQYHLWWQVYQLYLQRGGKPIPLKEQAVPEATFAPGPSTPSAPRPDATIMEARSPFAGPQAAAPGEAQEPATTPFAAPEKPGAPPESPPDVPPTLPPP